MAKKTCNGIRYMIRQGDTLYKISRIYRVPLALILRANPYVDVYNLQIGDEICIPLVPQYVKPPAPGAPNPFDHLMIYVIQAGDTLESILNRFGLSMEDFLKYNQPNGMMLQPGSTIQLPEVGAETAPARADAEYGGSFVYPDMENGMPQMRQDAGTEDGMMRMRPDAGAGNGMLPESGWPGVEPEQEYDLDDFMQEGETEIEN